MKKILLLSVILLLMSPTCVVAGTTINPATGELDVIPTFTEEDGSPVAYNCQTIKVANGNLTDNGDGTCSVADQGGGAGGDNVTVNGTGADTTANIKDSTDIQWTLGDGGAGGPDDITGAINWTAFPNDQGYLTEVNWDELPLITDVDINWTDFEVPDAAINWAVQVPLNESDPVFSAWDGATGINWTAFPNDQGYISSVNWDELPTIQTDDINWDSIVNEEIFESAINWTDSYIPSTSINWTDFPNDQGYLSSVNWSELPWIQTGNINWTSIENAEIYSAGINWTDIEGVAPITEAMVGDLQSYLTSESDPQVGAVDSSKVCQGDGDSVECNLTQDGSGACAASAVCTGGHTHTVPDTKTGYFEDPTDADDFTSVICNDTGADWTFTKISCESDQTVNMDWQVDDGTPADIVGTDLVCDSTPGTACSSGCDQTISGDGTLSNGECVDLAITSTSGTPTWLSYRLTFTKVTQ